MSICSQNISSFKELQDLSIRNKRLTSLQKGGSVISTRIGNIQYGSPPETLKDCLNQNLDVPQYYIVPEQTFDKITGINLMEFEFPVYYNFFLKKQLKTKIICNSKTMQEIIQIFQESLLGPLEFPDFDDEFIDNYKAKPDIKKELLHFAVNPFNKQQKLTVDLFLEFLILENDKYVIEKDIIENDQKEFIKILIQKNPNRSFSIFENDKLLITFEKDIILTKEYFMGYQNISNDTNEYFSPPVFGITMLGSSHGFDVGDSTSGFILWINKKGIMIDPPPFASLALKQKGVTPNLIEKIIISHCHADHDAGTFHKIIEAAQIEFISTKTILNSFLTKYSAVSQMDIEELKTLFDYRFVKIGHPTFILGARFIFSYSFHSIPTLRFEVEFQNKKFFFSADTFYDPEELYKIYEKGIFTLDRYKQLAETDFSQYDLILHESGIPPIHTPTKILQKFPDEIKKKLYLYHCAHKDVPGNSGLQSIKVGLQNTIRILDESSYDGYSNLEFFCSLELVNWLPLNRIPEVLSSFKEKKYKKGDVVIAKGTTGESFYIIKWGLMKCYGTNEQGEEIWSKIYQRGDFFGETALLNKGPRLATVECVTDSVILEIGKNDFNWIFTQKHQKNYFSMTFLSMIQNLSQF